MNTPSRIELARQVFECAFEGFESFREQNVGADLGYLLGALLDPPEKESFVDWTPDVYGVEPPALLAVLQKNFKDDSPLWDFIWLYGKPRGARKIIAEDEALNQRAELLAACQIVLAAQKAHRWKVNADEADAFGMVALAVERRGRKRT